MFFQLSHIGKLYFYNNLLDKLDEKFKQNYFWIWISKITLIGVV